MIKKQKVKTYEVKLFCDYCLTEMRFTGDIKSSNPPLYVHHCTNKDCSNVHQIEIGGPTYFADVNEDKKYPYYEYVPAWGVEF